MKGYIYDSTCILINGIAKTYLEAYLLPNKCFFYFRKKELSRVNRDDGANTFFFFQEINLTICDLCAKECYEESNVANSRLLSLPFVMFLTL